MNELDYNKVLQDFQYKPNFGYYTFKSMEECRIRITMWVENSRSTWKQWDIHTEQWQNGGMFADYDVAYNYTRYIPPTTKNYSPSREVIEVVGTFVIPPDAFLEGDEDSFISWVVFTIKAMEDHETNEWARYKGELLNDPHKEKV